MYTEDNIILVNKLLNGNQLSKLCTFEVAARHCSFLLAASELNITPSAISHRISSLEEELGFKLFKRFHRKIELTDEGETLFLSFKYIFDYINQEVIKIKSQKLFGSLSIYSRPTFAEKILAPNLANFHRSHPLFNINILTGNENVNFRRYDIDLAIYFDDCPPDNLVIYPLMGEYITPVCSPEYANELNLIENINNLQHCTLLHDRQAWGYSSEKEEWESWAKNFNFDVNLSEKNIAFDYSGLAVTSAINHLGVAIGRVSVIDEKIKNKKLIIPFLNKEIKCKEYYYACTIHEKKSEKVSIFIQWLKSIMLITHN